MIVTPVKDFTTWDATGKVEGVKGKPLDVLDSTAELLKQMNLVAEPDPEPVEKPKRKRKKRAETSEE